MVRVEVDAPFFHTDTQLVSAVCGKKHFPVSHWVRWHLCQRSVDRMCVWFYLWSLLFDHLHVLYPLPVPDCDNCGFIVSLRSRKGQILFFAFTFKHCFGYSRSFAFTNTF